MREASAALEEETQRLAAVQARLKEENQRLEERGDTQARRCQRDQDTQAELQAALKQMTSAHAQLVQRLAEEESSKKNLQKGSMELQVKLTAVQEERAALGQQLQLEREVHQTELDNTKALMGDSRTKKYREVQDMLKLCRQERDEIQAHLKEVKVSPFYKYNQSVFIHKANVQLKKEFEIFCKYTYLLFCRVRLYHSNHIMSVR